MPNMKTDTLARSPRAIWERVVQFEKELSPAAARALLEVRFSQRDLKYMDVLSANARSGTLMPQEQVDLDQYERLACLLDILHSKARSALKPRRTAS